MSGPAQRLGTYAPGLALAALAAAAVIGLHHALNSDAPVQPVQIETPPDWIDYSLEELDATGTTGDGRRYHIRAARLDHYRNDGSSHLAEPRFTLYRDGHTPRHSSAGRGWLSADGSLLRLYGDVRVSEGGNDAR